MAYCCDTLVGCLDFAGGPPFFCGAYVFILANLVVEFNVLKASREQNGYRNYKHELKIGNIFSSPHIDLNYQELCEGLNCSWAMCNSIAGNSKFCMGYSSCLYYLTVNLLVISFFAIPNYRQPELQVIRDTGNISAGWLFWRNLNGAVGLQQKVGFAGLICLWWDEKEVTNAWSNKKLVFLLWPVSCLAHLLCIRTCGCSATVPNISHFL